MTTVLHLCGAFLQCDDPAGLAAWYADTLGLALQDWGGGACFGLSWDHTTEAGLKSHTILSLQKAKTPLGTSPRTCVVNLRVAGLKALMSGLQAKGVAVEGPTEDPYGSFAWLTDPEGNRLELYEAAD